MGFDNRQAAKEYAAQEGDTLESIAARETAAGNELTWQELALFYWGTARPDYVQELMRYELGCHRRGDANRFIISTDDERKGEFKIPRRFARGGFPVNKVHTLRVRKRECPPQFLDCCSIPGITFEFDKSFVRPQKSSGRKAATWGGSSPC